MKKNYLFLVALLVSLFCLHQSANAQQPSLIIGIVDIISVIEKHPVMADNIPLIDKSFQAEVIEFNKFKQQDCVKKINELKQQFKLDSPEYQTQMQTLQNEVQQRAKVLQEKEIKLRAEMVKYQFKAFTDIKAILEEVALEKGILAVMAYSKLKDEKRSQEAIGVTEFMSNTVLWNRTECDITKDVIARMAQKLGVPKGPAEGGALNGISSQLGAPGQQPAGGMPPAGGMQQGQGVQQLMQIQNR